MNDSSSLFFHLQSISTGFVWPKMGTRTGHFLVSINVSIQIQSFAKWIGYFWPSFAKIRSHRETSAYSQNSTSRVKKPFPSQRFKPFNQAIKTYLLLLHEPSKYVNYFQRLFWSCLNHGTQTGKPY
jgi:hypothetical protein